MPRILVLSSSSSKTIKTIKKVVFFESTAMYRCRNTYEYILNTLPEAHKYHKSPKPPEIALKKGSCEGTIWYAAKYFHRKDNMIGTRAGNK